MLDAGAPNLKGGFDPEAAPKREAAMVRNAFASGSGQPKMVPAWEDR